MFFRGERDRNESPPSRRLTAVRDVVEIVAIVAAGIWAFYVFAYENRIKPSMAKPDLNFTASVQRLSVRDGLIAVGLRLEFRNIGTVRAHLLGFAVNVYGRKIVEAEPRIPSAKRPAAYEFDAYYRAGPEIPVYSYAYLTSLGDPATKQDTVLDPGTSIDNYRTFYVPQGRFDLLTVGIDAPYTKYEEATIPTHLATQAAGDVRVVTTLGPKVEQYNVLPVSSLDLR